MVWSIARKAAYLLWSLNGYVGREVSTKARQKATVLITYYSPERIRNINSQVRNILKCSFVEQLIISNHNPDIEIELSVKVADHRLVFRNQAIRRGCGHRWSVAMDFNPAYLIVIDDDVLLFPWQLRALFEYLLNNPDVPHGLAGMRHKPDGGFEYSQRETRQVDYLTETYALTRRHLQRYSELRRLVARESEMETLIEFVADFMLVSRSGNGKPEIHNTGRLLRCRTFNQAGVAVCREKGFWENLSKVSNALHLVSVPTGDHATALVDGSSALS